MNDEKQTELNVISELKIYVDKKGGEVREIKPILEQLDGNLWSKCSENVKSQFFGSAIIPIPTGNPQQPYVQHPIHFKFPDDIIDFQDAFNKFPNEMEKEIKKQKDDFEKQMFANGGKGLIVPKNLKFKK